MAFRDRKHLNSKPHHLRAFDIKTHRLQPRDHLSLEKVVQTFGGEAYFSPVDKQRVQEIAKRLNRHLIDDKHFIITFNKGEYTERGFQARTDYTAATETPFKTVDPTTCKQTEKLASAIKGKEDTRGKKFDVLNIPGSNFELVVYVTRDDRAHVITPHFETHDEQGDHLGIVCQHTGRFLSNSRPIYLRDIRKA